MNEIFSWEAEIFSYLGLPLSYLVKKTLFYARFKNIFCTFVAEND